MRRTVVLVSLGGVLLAGCADQAESLIVTQAPAWTSTDCNIDPATDIALARGYLDVVWGTPYLLPLSVLNNLSDTQRGSTTQVTNEIRLSDADVELTATDDRLFAGIDPAFLQFNVPLASISIEPNETVGVTVEAISSTVTEQLNVNLAAIGANASATLVASVVIHGEESGGSVGKVGEVDAREFTFPIQICQGCLLTCETCPDGQCPATYTDFVGGICGNAQDLYLAPSTCEVPEA